MSEMVELSTLKEILCEGCNENCEEIFCDYQSLFKCIPTIDAVPVVHGHWEYVNSCLLLDYNMCSVCGNVTGDYIINDQTMKHDNPYYCPRCGAKMDEVTDDEKLS